METLTERMNMKFGEVAGAHVIHKVKSMFSAPARLCLICAEEGIDIDEISDSDLYSAANILKEFVGRANEESGYTVSVWFDADDFYDEA